MGKNAGRFVSALLALALTMPLILLAEEPAAKPPPPERQRLSPREIYEKYQYGGGTITTIVEIDISKSEIGIPFAEKYRSVNDLPDNFPVILKKGGDKYRLAINVTKTSEPNEISFSGSGWFYDKEATLITDLHVVKAENDELNSFFGSLKITKYRYLFEMLDKAHPATPRPRYRRYQAKLLGGEASTDTAALQVLGINSRDYDVAAIGNPDLIDGQGRDIVTQNAYALGTPYGFENTWSAPGVISALHRVVGMWDVEDFVQITTPINPGNSGSPLLNDYGEVIGMNDLGLRGADNISFAISTKLINVIKLKGLNGQVAKPLKFGADVRIDPFRFSGTPENLDLIDLSDLAEATGFSRARALKALAETAGNRWSVITAVEADSPADKAGLKKGDVITKIGVTSIDADKKSKEVFTDVFTGMDLRILLNTLRADDEVTVAFQRIDAEGTVTNQTVKVKLIERLSE